MPTVKSFGPETRLLHSMKRDALKRGIVTLSIGGGQGIALALETL
jgi:acetyl-CoA C-acetyltransferase